VASGGIGKIMNKYFKTKNRMNAVIIAAVFIFLIYHFTLNNTRFAISDDTVPYVILVFIVLLSMFLVNLSEDNDQKHNEIVSILNRQDPYVPFAKQVGDSDYEFMEMVNKATRSIFIVGPNLDFIANEKDGKVKELLFKKMKKNSNFKILMLLSDPDCKEICDAMSKETFTDTFLDELIDAIGHLVKWKKEAEKNKLKSQLFIRKTSIITLSLLFIDKEEPNACVLVTPIPCKVGGALRPCFLIEKQQHEEAFNRYYDAYKELCKSKKVREIE
jgi:hypothetical protein